MINIDVGTGEGGGKGLFDKFHSLSFQDGAFRLDYPVELVHLGAAYPRGL